MLIWLQAVHLRKYILTNHILLTVLAAAVPMIVWLLEVRAFHLMEIPPGKCFFIAGPVVYAYAFFTAMATLLREVLKDLEDYRMDLRARNQSLPVLIGVGNARKDQRASRGPDPSGHRICQVDHFWRGHVVAECIPAGCSDIAIPAGPVHASAGPGRPEILPDPANRETGHDHRGIVHVGAACVPCEWGHLLNNWITVFPDLLTFRLLDITTF